LTRLTGLGQMKESDVVNIALIVGSTRPNRFADVPARWIERGSGERSDMTLETLDLRDWPLPFFNEPAPPTRTEGVFTNAVAERWRHKLGKFDGFIAVAAEYNHGPTAVLKNAFDSALNEWKEKPISFVGYGGVGGARAIEQLRMNAIELQMAPIKQAVHIGLEPFLGILTQGKTPDDYTYLVSSRTAMFDQLVWWARALATARAAASVLASIAD
jgi:NAD(P)H-dependent FMN reductase